MSEGSGAAVASITPSAARESSVFGFLSGIGRSAAALDSAKRAVALDPLNPAMHRALGDDLYDARRYPDRCRNSIKRSV
jgi:hypothetical protein